MLADPDPRIHLFGSFEHQKANTIKYGDDFRAYMNARIGRAEALLRQRFAASRDVSVVIGGRTYTAGRSRGNHLVEPVWVAMLTPADD